MDEVCSVQQTLAEERKRRTDMTKTLSDKDKEIRQLLAQIDTLQSDSAQIMTDMTDQNAAGQTNAASQSSGSSLDQRTRARARALIVQETTQDREVIRELRGELEAYRNQVRQLSSHPPAAAVTPASTPASAAVSTTAASSDNDRSMLLAEVLKSRLQIDQLTQKLKTAQSHSHSQSQNKSRGSALKTVNALEDQVAQLEDQVAQLEDQVAQLEDERDQQRRQHEHQIKKILKATGGYDKAQYDRWVIGENNEQPYGDGDGGGAPVDLSDAIVDLFRHSQDEERLKVGIVQHNIA